MKTAVIYLERPDYIELMAEIMSRLVYVDWQRHVSTDRSRLMNAGICELCMILLTKYITNSKITCHCFMVIHNLGQCSTSAIKIKLRDAGACEIIVDSLRENCIKSSQSENNIGVAYSGLMAVDALTDYFQNDALVIQEIINKFVTAGLCEIVMIILEKYAKDSVIEYDWSPQDDSIDSVLDCAQSVIRNLAFNNKTIRCKLNQLGAGNWLPELF